MQLVFIFFSPPLLPPPLSDFYSFWLQRNGNLTKCLKKKAQHLGFFLNLSVFSSSLQEAWLTAFYLLGLALWESDFITIRKQVSFVFLTLFNFFISLHKLHLSFCYNIKQKPWALFPDYSTSFFLGEGPFPCPGQTLINKEIASL